MGIFRSFWDIYLAAMLQIFRQFGVGFIGGLGRICYSFFAHFSDGVLKAYFGRFGLSASIWSPVSSSGLYGAKFCVF